MSFARVLRFALSAVVVLLTAANASAASSNPDAVAVIIGNARYQHRDVPPVEFAGRDARAMRRYVIDVLGFDEKNVLLVEDATLARMNALFGTAENPKREIWRYVVEGESDLFVFYSGHGVPGVENGRNYLLPVDADPAAGDANGYPLALVYENLTRIGARSVTVVLDACFTGGSEGGQLLRNISPLLRPAATPLPPGAAGGLTVIAATAPDQVASWDREARHGLFTEWFLRGAYGAADDRGQNRLANGDGTVTLDELQGFLDRHMTQAAKRTAGREQRATVTGGTPGLIVSAFPAGSPPARPSLDGAPAPRPVVGVPAPRSERSPGTRFRDCAECPEMVVVPAGPFTMGSPPTEPERLRSEGPQQAIMVPRSFAVGRFEVTFAQWDACLVAGGCDGHRPHDAGWGRGSRPVIQVSWQDAQAYVAWLNGRFPQAGYRLLTEAEWEYVARAGTVTPYPWGSAIGIANTNGRDSGSAWSGRQTSPVGSFAPNAFGLHDLPGNVQEWVEDCHREDLSGQPPDGAAYLSGSCEKRVVRGGSWWYSAMHHRSAFRFGFTSGNRNDFIGFRIARTPGS